MDKLPAYLMFKRRVDRTCKLSRQNNTRLQISTSASDHLPVHRIFLKVWHYKHSLNKVHREVKLMILHAKLSACICTNEYV